MGVQFVNPGMQGMNDLVSMVRGAGFDALRVQAILSLADGPAAQAGTFKNWVNAIPGLPDEYKNMSKG